MNNRLIGIVGGMGHGAGLDLAAKLVQVWPSHVDGPRFVIVSDGAIPDRTEALLEGGADFVPAVVAQLERLCEAGAELAAIACNTAHARLPAIREQSPIPVLDMIELTCAHIARTFGRHERLGLLGTRATIMLDLYGSKLQAAGFPLVPADDRTTELAHQGIMQVKRGALAAGAHLLGLAESRLIDAGATVIVMGCTEIPLAFSSRALPTHIDMRLVTPVDPTLILAKALVAEACTVHPNRPTETADVRLSD